VKFDQPASLQQVMTDGIDRFAQYREEGNDGECKSYGADPVRHSLSDNLE
jgi:hypothetical protein